MNRGKGQRAAVLAVLALTLGIVAGWSASTVTGMLIGAVITLFLAAAGLRPIVENPGQAGQRIPSLDSAEAFVVSMGLISGLALGVATRVYHVFGPTREERMEAWAQLGFTPKEARGLVVLEVFGHTPATEGGKPADVTLAGLPFLFSAGGSERLGSLDPGLFDEDPDEYLAAFARKGGQLAELALLVSSAGSDELRFANLQRLWDVARGDFEGGR